MLSAPTPTWFVTKVPSSGSFVTTKDHKSNMLPSISSLKLKIKDLEC